MLSLFYDVTQQWCVCCHHCQTKLKCVSTPNALSHVAIMASIIRIVFVWVEQIINGRQSEKNICCEPSPSISCKTSQYLREFNSHRSMSERRALQKHCWGRVALTIRTPAEIPAQIFQEMWWRCRAPSCTFTGSVCFVCINAAASKFSR